VTDRDIRNIGVNWASLQGMQFGVGNIGQSWTRNRDQTFSNSSGGSGTTTINNGSTANNTTTFVTSPQVDDNGDFATSVFNPQTGAVTGLPSSLPSTTGVVGFVPGTPGSSGAVVDGVLIPAVPEVRGSFTAPNTFTGSQTNGNTITSAINSLNSLVNGGSTSRVATAVFSASDFNVIISALKTQSNTKVMSNPTVVTLNNTEATLNIGQEFPVPSYNYNSERGTFEVAGFTYKPIGIILKVTPQVNARGVIKLSLEPEVSQQSDSTSFGGAGGALIPIISTRRVKTQVSLKDGYTMGIGGLITDAKSDGGNKVPVLGSIPVLGRLFSNKSVNNTATNLLIFVTAKTVSADGASPEEVFDPRAIKATGMSREDMPGFRAPAGVDMFAAPKSPAGK
jgi:type IV pilus assembly protein PilQ